MLDKLTKANDLVIGKAATMTGMFGLSVQWITDFSSLILIGINIVLALGGIWLVWLRIKKARIDLHDRKDGER